MCLLLKQISQIQNNLFCIIDVNIVIDIVSILHFDKHYIGINLL